MTEPEPKVIGSHRISRVVIALRRSHLYAATCPKAGGEWGAASRSSQVEWRLFWEQEIVGSIPASAIMQRDSASLGFRKHRQCNFHKRPRIKAYVLLLRCIAVNRESAERRAAMERRREPMYASVHACFEASRR